MALAFVCIDYKVIWRPFDDQKRPHRTIIKNLTPEWLPGALTSQCMFINGLFTAHWSSLEEFTERGASGRTRSWLSHHPPAPLRAVHFRVSTTISGQRSAIQV